MFTGTAEERQRREAEARAVAEKVARLLNELQEFGPVTPNRILFAGGWLRCRDDRWVAE